MEEKSSKPNALPKNKFEDKTKEKCSTSFFHVQVAPRLETKLGVNSTFEVKQYRKRKTAARSREAT